MTTQKEQLEKINEFFDREDYNETELKIKKRATELEAKLVERRNKLGEVEKALQDLNGQYKTLQQEVLMVSQQLNGIFQIVLDLVPEKEDKEEE